ncbi:putative transposable element [Trichonephila clavipes]|nr:putative transposable element [Trichonephila clavipes]
MNDDSMEYEYLRNVHSFLAGSCTHSLNGAVLPISANGSGETGYMDRGGAVVTTRRCNMSLSSCHNRLLKDTFGDRQISRFGPVIWPPRSCDLTPLDYFLWGYVKSLVYADKPQTLDHLEDNIHRVIADIRLQMLEKVIENWTSRLDYIRASCGSHMPEIIFKM